MSANKPTITGKITCNCYAVLQRAVEEGMAYGVRRAFKHSQEQISEDQMAVIEEQCEQAVMNEICEWFKFED